MRTEKAPNRKTGFISVPTPTVALPWRTADGCVKVHKESLRLREFVEHVAVPEKAGEAIFHVRGYTKGVPSVNDNNHPVRYGRAVVVHNGHLDNDDELFRRHGAPRSTPHITVDSNTQITATTPAMPAGMATSAITMARMPRATNQRWSDLFTRQLCHSGRAATRRRRSRSEKYSGGKSSRLTKRRSDNGL